MNKSSNEIPYSALSDMRELNLSYVKNVILRIPLGGTEIAYPLVKSVWTNSDLIQWTWLILANAFIQLPASCLWLFPISRLKKCNQGLKCLLDIYKTVVFNPRWHMFNLTRRYFLNTCQVEFVEIVWYIYIFGFLQKVWPTSSRR